MNLTNVIELAKDKGCLTSLYKAMEKNQHVELFILTIVQKWLRDEKHIDIEVLNQYTNAEYKSYFCKILHTSRTVTTNYNSYEEALLHGIGEALKLI